MARKLYFATFKGLKCDNPDCDYVDTETPFEDYVNWVNKKCPKCGAILLTEEDYKECANVVRASETINDFFSDILSEDAIGSASYVENCHSYEKAQDAMDNICMIANAISSKYK